MSVRSAYRLRGRPEADDFDLAWRKALRRAGSCLMGVALDRAINGTRREIWKDGTLSPGDSRGFHLTHHQLGEMANLSRHHVGRKLADFEAAGWVACGYNRIRIIDAQGPAALAYAGDDD